MKEPRICGGPSPNEEAAHRELLHAVSRSFYLSVRFLPAPMRAPVSLGYLLARFTDTVADAPGLAQEQRLSILEGMRLVILEEMDLPAVALAEVESSLALRGERELVRRVPELIDWYRTIDPANREHLSEVILTILHGQQWDITFFEADGMTAPPGREELLRYTYQVAGCVGEFWTKTGFTNLGDRFADPDKATSMLLQGRKLGQALQLINILRDLYEDLPRGRCYLPADELRAAGWTGDSPLCEEEITPVFVRWLGLCEDFLDEADGYVRDVRCFRSRFCTRLPRILAADTAALLHSAGAGSAMVRKVRIPRRAVWQAIFRAVFL